MSPLELSAVYWDFVLARAEASTKLVDVELRICQKAFVDEAADACRRAGLMVAQIRFEGDVHPAAPGRFPTYRPAVQRRIFRRYGFVALCGAAILLVLLLLASALARNDRELSAIDDAIADAGVRAARVEQLRTQIRETAHSLAYVSEQKRHGPSFISILADLTRALPDDTYVTEIAMEGSKVRIQGISGSASDLIGKVDHVAGFSGATFDAPLTHDSASNAEHFDLSFDVKGPSR